MVEHRVPLKRAETLMRFTRFLCAGMLSLVCVCPLTVLAQIVRDGRLGPAIGTPGVLEPTGPHFRIDSTLGEIRSGNGTANLFHSFSEFNVQSGQSATFTNSLGGTINNILSRVTGNNPSTINGLLASEIPGANLYLLNPRGVVFGPNAALDVGASIGQPGSFFVTTADYVRLGSVGDRGAGIFSANPLVSDVLTSAPITAFGFLGPPAAITFAGSRLPGDLLNPAIHPETGNPIPVPAGQTFAVIGGDITVGPDPATGTPASIVAPGGQIDIFSTRSAGELNYPSFSFTQNVNGQTFTAMGTIRLTGRPADGIPGTLDVTDYFGEHTGAGGAIRIRGGQFEMDNASVIADTIMDVPGAATGISVAMTSTETLEPTEFDVTLKNGSMLLTENFGPAGSGAIEVSGRKVRVESGSSIQTTSIEGDLGLGALGSSGNITVTGTESITVTGTGPFNVIRSSIVTQASGTTGDSGSITLSAPTVNVQDFGLVRTFVPSSGSAGRISIVDNVAENIIVRDLNVLGGGAIEITNSGSGKTGLLTINTTDSVTISGQFSPGNPSHITLARNQFSTDQEVGLVSIKTGQLLVKDGAEVHAEGDRLSGVHIDIDAILGATISNGGLIAVVNGSQQLGSLTMKAPSISLNNAEVRSRTFTDRDAGPMKLEATTGDIFLDNGSLVRVSTENGTGDGGALSLIAPLGSIRLSGGSSAESSSVNSSSGDGGSITAQAGNILSLSGAGTGLFTLADATSTGNGGNITAAAGQSVNVNDGASISAGSTGSGNAGTITIHAGSDFLNSGGIVRTTAAHGLGGDILITAGQDIRLNSSATISASSTGPGNAGSITALAGDDFVMQNSSMTTQATQASGGNIKIGAPDQIVLQNSLVSASVMGGGGGGGNISIDPTAVILQNSQILAQAFLGNGGNITITTPLFLADQTSLVSASSQFGLNGTVNIQSPTSNLSGTVSSLPSSMRQAQSLQTGRCAALADNRSSSLIVAGRDTMPTEPGGWLSSPFALAGEDGGPFAQPAIQPTALLASAHETLSLRRLTPAGFLTQHFAESELTVCRS